MSCSKLFDLMDCSIMLNPITGKSNCSLVTKNGTCKMSCSGDNLKSNCTQPVYFMGLPFAAVRLRSASISSEISLTFKSGIVLSRKCPEIIET